MIALDAIDRKILDVLQVKADLSQSALAEKVGCSQTSCWRRLRSLEQTGVLGPVTRMVNAAVVGLTVNVICQVRINQHGRDMRNEFEKFILSRPEVLECYSMSGDWDYQLRIVVRTIEEYEEFLMNHVLKMPDVAQTSSQFALKQLKFTTVLSV